MIEQPEEQAYPVCSPDALCEELSFNLGSALALVWDDEGSTEHLRTAIDYVAAEQERVSHWNRSSGSYDAFSNLLSLAYDSVNGSIQVGAPHSAKKLFRVVALHPATPPLLEEVLLSLADDSQNLEALKHIIEQHIRKLEEGAPIL